MFVFAVHCWLNDYTIPITSLEEIIFIVACFWNTCEWVCGLFCICLGMCYTSLSFFLFVRVNHSLLILYKHPVHFRWEQNTKQNKVNSVFTKCAAFTQQTWFRPCFCQPFGSWSTVKPASFLHTTEYDGGTPNSLYHEWFPTILHALYLDKRLCCRILSVSLDPRRDPLQTVVGYRSASGTWNLCHRLTNTNSTVTIHPKRRAL